MHRSDDAGTYRTLVENAVEGIFRTSPDGRYLYANPSLARIYGYGSPEELKSSVTNIAKQLYVDPVRRTQFLEEIGKRGEVRDFISEIWRKDKTKIWILENVREIRSPEGSAECFEGFVSDVTSQMLMIERLRRSERMEAIGQLSAGIAHDFNNMLAAIRGYAELISGVAEDARESRYASSIVKACERASELTRKLLLLSRKEERSRKVSDLNKLSAEVASLLQRSVGKRIGVKTELKAARAAAFCDGAQVSNAILNLAVNARDAMPEGGTILIKTENVRLEEPKRWCRPGEFHAGDFVKLSVEDDGAGMELDATKRLFEPFFTTKPTGTGLGLAGVHAMAKAHRGTIDVESSPGKGSKFSVFLPLEFKMASETETAREGAGPCPGMTRGSGRLLLADDNELNLSFLAEMLRSLGYEVEECENGKKAYERYQASWRDFDLAILDVDMPEMGGVEAYRAMRSLNPSAKAIFVTGLGESCLGLEAVACGAAALFRKPYDPRELSRRIAAEIEGAKS